WARDAPRADPARRPSPLVGTGRRTTSPSVAGGSRISPGAWSPGGVHIQDRDAPGSWGALLRRLRGRRARPDDVTRTRWACARRDDTSRTAGRRPGRRSGGGDGIRTHGLFDATEAL